MDPRMNKEGQEMLDVTVDEEASMEQNPEASMEQTPEAAVVQPPVYTNAPGPSSMPCMETVANHGYNAESGEERNDPNIFSAVQSAISTTCSDCSTWSDVNHQLGSPSSRPPQAKCPHCPHTAFRERIFQHEIARRARANEEMAHKIARLEHSNFLTAALMEAVCKADEVPNPPPGVTTYTDEDIAKLAPSNSTTAELLKLLLNSKLRPDT